MLRTICLLGVGDTNRGRQRRPATGRRAGIFAVAAAGLLALGGGPALASGVSCGTTVTADTRLRADLRNCPGDGLVIAADNITLDLNGHTIDGDATPSATGVDVGIGLATHHGVTIKRGTVQEFDGGVELVGASDNHIRALKVLTNSGRGIDAEEGSDGNRIEGNIVARNGRSGIAIVVSGHNRVHGNSVSDNAAGIAGVTATENRIENNVVSGNTSDGIFLIDGANDNQLDGNWVSGSGAGVDIESANDNLVRGNRVVRNIEGIVFGGDRNLVVRNRVADGVACEDAPSCGAGLAGIGGTGNVAAGNRITRIRGLGIRLNAFEEFGGPPTIGTVIRANVITSADTDGIGVATDLQDSGTVEDTLLEANVVIRSGHDGINVASPATTVTRNLAIRNVNLGIEAVPGVTDGGGNHAFANGNPVQCLNVVC